jgi:hypothetical protein
MRFHKAAASVAYAWLALASAAQADDPKVAVTRIPNLPSKLFYFDDTTVRYMAEWAVLTMSGGSST